MVTLLENLEKLSLMRTGNIHWKPDMSQGLYSQVSICDFIYSSEKPSKEVLLSCFTSQDSERLRVCTWLFQAQEVSNCQRQDPNPHQMD